MSTHLLFPQALQNFEIRPTPSPAAAAGLFDELMIDTGSVPPGSKATFFLPGLDVSKMLSLSAAMYVTQRFTLIDDHTLGWSTGGICYLPIPTGPAGNLAGLITITLSPSTPIGKKYDVVVRQVTSNANLAVQTRVVRARKLDSYRYVLGAFQITLAIKERPQTLKMISRLYSVMSWIRQDIDPTNRWYPVFDQYLSGLGELITGMNRDVTQIAPSPYGLLPPISTPRSRDGECDSVRRNVGKIHGLRYDHFGDFEGFILETPEGHMRVFFSREKQMFEVISRAWAERLLVDVEEARPRIPLRVVLLPPSA